MSSVAKFAISIVLVLAIAIGVLSQVLDSGTKSTMSPANKPSGGKAAATAKSRIWKKGTEWNISRTTNSSGVMLDSQGTAYTQTFHFIVTKAPRTSSGKWVVRAFLTGAQGPLADGFSLYYRADKDGNMQIFGGALGSGERAMPVELEQITMLVGPDFPLTLKYTEPPKDGFASAVNHRNSPPSAAAPH